MSCCYHYVRLLPRLTGTTVTTYDDTSEAEDEDSWTWVIKHKLSERAVHQTETDVKLGGGTPMTVGKFLCHLEGHPDREAFMRVYYQIPIDGTEDADVDTLAQQAVPPEACGELESFNLLKGCPAVPRFLGHVEKTQEEHDLVPGWYIRYIAWEKVPGKPLTKEFFWSLDLSMRDEIRSKFRTAYEQVMSCGTKLGFGDTISKIIFDELTGNLHISGFRRGWPVFGKFEWSESCYVVFLLAKPCNCRDWALHPKHWEW